MAPSQSYDVPDEFLNLEQKGRPFDAVSQLTKLLKLNRSHESKYIEVFRTMIYLEEASQSHFMLKFNQKDIKLQYSGNEREFLIKCEVRHNRRTKF